MRAQARVRNFWCDPSTGLCWTLVEPEEITMLHTDAEAYCENLSLAGRGDWDLPTLDQWLESPGAATAKRGPPKPRVTSPIVLSTPHWTRFQFTPCPQLSGTYRGLLLAFRNGRLHDRFLRLLVVKRRAKCRRLLVLYPLEQWRLARPRECLALRSALRGPRVTALLRRFCPT